jgi:hypothetical protein
MALGGVLGKGCKVAYSTASPVSWVQVTQLIDLTIPTQIADRVDNTMHSTAGSLKRSMPGLVSVGDPTITVVQDLDPATCASQAYLRARQVDQTTVWFRLEVPVNRAKTLFMGFVFQAAVANYEPSTPIADRQTTKFTLMFDGESIQEDAASGASSIA